MKPPGGFLSVLETAHEWVSARVGRGDTVIDATVGGGRDSLRLARLCGPEGRLYGFDIQQDALNQAAQRMEAADEPLAECRWFCRSHAAILEVLPNELQGLVAAVMFNLGYLPGGDKSLTTVAEHTLPALDCAIRLLRTGGIVTVVAYTGHEGGQSEAEAVLNWVQDLPQAQYQALMHRYLNQRNHPPFLIGIEKK